MASLDGKALWEQTLMLLKNELGDDEYAIWFSKITFVRAGESEIFAAAPNNFFLEMFKQKYLPHILAKIGELAGKKIDVTLEVPQKGEKQPETAAPPSPHPLAEQKTTPSGRNSAVQSASDAPQTTAQKKSNPQLQEEFTFETYIVGEVNNYAFNAASAIARNPGKSKIYNPLLIYGGTGLGKTHLMQALGHFVHNNSELKIHYITGEGFMREFIETVALGQKNKDAFAKKYRNVDVLLIDDIHTIERGAGTQDELFYTFEALYNKKKQMVFTCDRPITELKGMAPRLQSRFQSGLSVELNLPNYEELIAILKKKMEMKKLEMRKNIVISDEIIEMIIKNISSNVREMEGALNKLMGYADLVNKPVTIEIAQRELKDVFADPRQGNMSIDIIQKVVAEEYNLSPNDLKGKKRSASIVKPRQISMYLCRELTEYSLTEIGEMFGNRDHTTVLHSCRQIEEMSRSDTNLYSALEKLKRMIKEHNVK
ncbi:MAG: chromosomal replication initiator protein DnaA [Treponema sp.]|jgi:chromosomal replication initiator protein|nr:chromosomal replication initiator protein DnaA [Treponema sp.]